MNVVHQLTELLYIENILSEQIVIFLSRKWKSIIIETKARPYWK